MKQSFKRLLVLPLCMMLVWCQMQAQEVRKHLVRPGETLYSISRLYEIPVDALMKANPGSNGMVICGTEIIIPAASAAAPAASPDVPAAAGSNPPAAAVPTVPATGRETAPQGAVTAGVGNGATTVAEAVTSALKWPTLHGATTVAIILPFHLNATTPEAVKMQMRCVEFYQGFLIAVDEAQAAGLSVSLQVYDLSTQGLSTILHTPALAHADLIVGPMEAADVRAVAAYGEQHNINVITPFTFDASLTATYRHLFQLNTSKSLLYPELTTDLRERFADYTLVFLTDSTEMTKNEDYVAYLQADLDRRGVEYYEYAYTDPADVGVIDSVLHLSGNVLYIPYTSSKEALRKMFPYLRYSHNSRTDSAEMAVLGYPEWQLYTSDFMEYYYDLNVYMFTKIYINPFAPDVIDFYKTFKYWYGKDPMAIYPKYALLGFDIGKYFLTALSEHGRRFENVIEGKTVETLQSVMSYRSTGLGGFMNRGLYLVHFTPQTTIEKYVIQ